MCRDLGSGRTSPSDPMRVRGGELLTDIEIVRRAPHRRSGPETSWAEDHHSLQPAVSTTSPSERSER